MPTMPATVEVVDRLGYGDLRTDVWQLYSWMFEHVNRMAAQRHLMTWEEFADWAQNPACTKYLIRDPGSGALVAIGTQTRELAEWPLISPAYFEHRWPELYRDRRIWYVGFIGVKGRQPRAFRQMLDVMSEPAREARGVTAMDFCAYNVEDRRVPAVSGAILHDIAPSMTFEPFDRQEFWLADFREATA